MLQVPHRVPLALRALGGSQKQAMFWWGRGAEGTLVLLACLWGANPPLLSCLPTCHGCSWLRSPEGVGRHG